MSWPRTIKSSRAKSWLIVVIRDFRTRILELKDELENVCIINCCRGAGGGVCAHVQGRYTGEHIHERNEGNEESVW